MSYEKTLAGDRCLLQVDGQRVMSNAVYDKIGMGNPRMRSALRILKDLGLLADIADEITVVTKDGKLYIESAILVDANELRVSYSQDADQTPSSLRLAIRAPGETRPRVSIPLSKKTSATAVVKLPENTLADTHGTLLATLIAEFGAGRIESPPVWIIQENRLTYDPGEGASPSKNKVEETGEGLPEWLDELGKRDGLAAVVDYLRHLNICFYDGAGGALGQRKFRIKIRDPFYPDVAPEWLTKPGPRSDDLEQAILEFVERHQKRRLRKHASRGNINGMENFLDIFTTLARLLYVYYKRGVVKRGRLIGRLCTFIELATKGRASEEEPFEGYLCAVSANLGRDVHLLQETCDETNCLAEVRAALLIAQSIRFDPKEVVSSGTKPTRPREVLPSYTRAFNGAIEECGLNQPEPNKVRRALEGYRMFSDAEIGQLIAESP